MSISLDEVSEYLDDFHKYGNYGMARCIEHSPDIHPSMRISSFGYKCMSCGARGSLEKLYSKVSGRLVFKEKTYNPSAYIWMKWEERFGSIQNIAKVAHRDLVNNPDLGHYLEERKIDSQIRTGMMGFLDGYYLFPIQDEYGDVQGIVARASPTIQTKHNRYTVSPDCPIKIYVPNWRKVLKDENLYICFGTLDAWSLNMAGYASITGISGQQFSTENADRFRKPMFIIPDKHEEKSAIELQCQLGWRGMGLFLDWPEGTKDINGIHMKYGIEKVIKLIENQKERYKYE